MTKSLMRPGDEATLYLGALYQCSCCSPLHCIHHCTHTYPVTCCTVHWHMQVHILSADKLQWSNQLYQMKQASCTSVAINSLHPMTQMIHAQGKSSVKSNKLYDQVVPLHVFRYNNHNISTYAAAVHSSVSITALAHTQWRVALSMDTRRYTIWKQKNCNQTLNYTRGNNKLHTPLQLSKVKPHSVNMIIHVTISSLVYNNYGTWVTQIKALMHVMWGCPMSPTHGVMYIASCLTLTTDQLVLCQWGNRDAIQVSWSSTSGWKRQVFSHIA